MSLRRSIAGLLLVIFSGVSCSKNLFSEFAKKTTDDAIYFDALKLTNEKKYTLAIEKFEDLSDTYLAKRDVQARYAAAYAGRCGLDLITLVDTVTADTSTNFFKLVMKAFTGATSTSVDDCDRAESIIYAISASANSRTADENILMAFVAIAKMGATMAAYADLDGDKVPDSGFDSCLVAQLPDARARKVATALNHFIVSLQAPGIPSSLKAISDTLNTACNTLGATGADYQFCGTSYAIYDPDALTANQAKILKVVIKAEDNPGLGTCAGNVATCALTCL